MSDEINPASTLTDDELLEELCRRKRAVVLAYTEELKGDKESTVLCTRFNGSWVECIGIIDHGIHKQLRDRIISGSQCVEADDD